MAVAGNIEVVNPLVRNVFTNTRENDMAIFVDSPSQSIHIGCTSNATVPSTVMVTQSNLVLNGDIVFPNRVISMSRLRITQPDNLMTTANISSTYSMIPGFGSNGSNFDISLGSQGSNFRFLSSTNGNVFAVLGLDGALSINSLSTGGTTRITNNGVMSNINRVAMSSGQVLGDMNDTVDAPAFAWNGESNTGFYHAGVGVVGVSCGGVNVASFSNGGVSIVNTLNAATLQQGGSNLSDLFVKRDGDIVSGNYTFCNTVNANTLQQGASNVSDMFISRNGDIVSGNYTFSNTVNAVTLQQAGSNLSEMFISKTGGTMTGTLTVSNLDFTGSLTNNGQPFVGGGGGSGGASFCNLAQNITTVPSNGYTNAVVSVPSITTRSVPSSASMSCGRVELNTNNSISLFANGTITVTVTHNFGNSNYLVFAVPDDETSLQVKTLNFTNNSFGMFIKNTSGSSLGKQGINYQMIQIGSNSNVVTLAQAVNVVISSVILTTVGASNSTTTFTFSNQVTDPQGYAIAYEIVSGNNNRTIIQTQSNLVYTNTGSVQSLSLTLKARNQYTDDPTKQLTITINELNRMTTSIMVTSSAILGSKHQTTIETLLPSKTYNLVYRASTSSYSGITLMNAINNKAPLLFVITANSGFIFTVYVPVTFPAAGTGFKSVDANTSWFNNLENGTTKALSTSKYYNTQNTHSTLYMFAIPPTSGGRTLAFGTGFELLINHPVNGQNSANLSYMKNAYDASRVYTGFTHDTMIGSISTDTWFTIDNLEVYDVL